MGTTLEENLKEFEEKPLLVKSIILGQAQAYKELQEKHKAQLSSEKLFQEINWLGRVENIFYINDDYIIVEYKEKDFQTKEITDISKFHPFLKGQSLHTSYATFDEALVGLIAEKYEGSNHQADGYFMKMIKD